MCRQPYMKRPTGIKKTDVIMSHDARLAATPFGCGQCLPCRINKAREWTHRLLLEQTMHGDSCFITLTYMDEHLPIGYNLKPTDLTNFLKKLRRAIEPQRIRYFAVGEYGDNSWRPHYHLAIFGLGIFYHNLIMETWGKGFIQMGDLNKDSARYMVGYCTKKMTNKKDTRLQGRYPEFMRCSKQKGGLGAGAVQKVADQLKKEKYFDIKILREFVYGKKKMPLGRYLSMKLAERIGVSELDLKMELWAHQEEIFEQHLKDDEVYYNNVQEEKQSERLSQEKKQQIFKQRKQI